MNELDTEILVATSLLVDHLTVHLLKKKRVQPHLDSLVVPTVLAQSEAPPFWSRDTSLYRQRLRRKTWFVEQKDKIHQKLRILLD